MIIITDYSVIQDITNVPVYSFSRLNSYYTCPYGYYLDYLADNDHRLKKTGNGFSDYGTFAHSIFEQFGKGELLQFELKPKFIDEFEKNIPNGVKLITKTKYVMNLTEKYKSAGAEFFDNFEGINGGKQIASEKDFRLLVKINGKPLILRGIIDAIVEDKSGNYHIWDFKSKSAFKSEEELAEYARQLYFYSLAIKSTYGKFPKTLNFLQFRINTIKTVEFNQKSFEETLQWIYDTSEIVENKEFWEAHCMEDCEDTFYQDNLCSYRYSCKYSPNYKEQEED